MGELDKVTKPDYYEQSYGAFEVWQALDALVDMAIIKDNGDGTYLVSQKPSESAKTWTECKYRLRAGTKIYYTADGALTDEESANRDIAKAMRCRQMRETKTEKVCRHCAFFSGDTCDVDHAHARPQDSCNSFVERGK
jgi:hypothetical protein